LQRDRIQHLRIGAEPRAIELAGDAHVLAKPVSRGNLREALKMWLCVNVLRPSRVRTAFNPYGAVRT
jgi:hypothetical protein